MGERAGVYIGAPETFVFDLSSLLIKELLR